MNQEIRVHKAGSITAGMSLIVFGILFILHHFVSVLSYEFIFSLWPAILVGLGIEILVASRTPKRFQYDIAGAFMILMMISLASVMAGVEVFFTYFKGLPFEQILR